MRSIAELTKDVRVKAELTDAHTRVASTGITDMRPTKWVAEVIRWAEDLRILDQIVAVNKQAVGTKDTKITIPLSTSHLSITTSTTEGTARTKTEMDNMDTTDAEFVVADFLMGVITISRPLMMTTNVDLITQAKFSIAEDMADDVDLAIATALQTTNVTTNQLWGGDATQVEDLTDGDVITTDLVADAKRQLALNNFIAKDLVISPYQEATFLKDSQFVNASEFGSDKIVLKGQIGEYLGMNVLVVNNDNFQYTGGDTELNEAASPGATMTLCPVLGRKKNGEKVSIGLPWKMMPEVDMEYEKDNAIQKIYYDQAFTTYEIFTEAISLIKVTNV